MGIKRLINNLSSFKLTLDKVVYEGKMIKKSLREAEPLFYNPSSSCKEDIPIMERGIKGVR